MKLSELLEVLYLGTKVNIKNLNGKTLTTMETVNTAPDKYSNALVMSVHSSGENCLDIRLLIFQD